MRIANLFVLFIVSYSCYIPELSGQCKMHSSSELKQLGRISYKKRIKKLNENNVRLLSQTGDKEKCEYRTYAHCRDYVNDTSWHWMEIITFNSCDNILSYSTSSEEHYRSLKEDLLNRYHRVSTRTYNDLEFEIYQNRRGQAVELNQHPNPQGLMFYLINILR